MTGADRDLAVEIFAENLAVTDLSERLQSALSEGDDVTLQLRPLVSRGGSIATEPAVLAAILGSAAALVNLVAALLRIGESLRSATKTRADPPPRVILVDALGGREEIHADLMRRTLNGVCESYLQTRRLERVILARGRSTHNE